MLTGVQLQKIFGPTNTKTEEFIKQAREDSSKQTHAIQLQTKAITNAKGLPTQDTTMQHQLNDLLKVMTEVYGKDGDGKITILLDGQKVSKTINKINSNNDLTGKGKQNGESTAQK
jgi:nitrate reductase NapAB chaperone NapD